MSTLFSILRLISVYSICHSQQSCQGLHYLPFLLSSIIKVYTTFHSQQSDQGLHYFPFSAVWSRSILFSILCSLIKFKIYTVILRNSLIKVYTIWKSQQSDQGQGLHCHSRNSLIRVYTNCHSQKSGQGLHCLPFSAVWSRSTILKILSSLIRVYTIYYS